MHGSDVPALVKKIRQATGWTQEKLAQEIGVSFSTVNGWERGRRYPQPFLLRKLQEIAEQNASD